MSLRTLVESVLAEGPVGRFLRTIPACEAAYWKFFCSRWGGRNFQFGYYGTFAAATAAIPARHNAGWNTAQSAAHYIEPSTQASSYAVLFWLNRLLRPGMQLVDLGGGVGQMYDAFVRRAALPERVRWTVVDVAAAVEAGRRKASSGDFAGLSFETRLAPDLRVDVLHASGALQYIGDTLAAVFDAFAEPPRSVVLNKLVLTSGPEFWTLQNIGTGICTYHVFNEDAFLAFFAARGYVVTDRWRVAEMTLLVPFYPEGHVRDASGFFFELAGRARASDA